MYLARRLESQLLLTVPVRLLGKSLPGCASFSLCKRHTCLWKNNVFMVLDKHLLCSSPAC